MCNAFGVSSNFNFNFKASYDCNLDRPDAVLTATDYIQRNPNPVRGVW